MALRRSAPRWTIPHRTFCCSSSPTRLNTAIGPTPGCRRSKKGHCVDAEQLQPEQLPGWLEGRMRRIGLEPEPDAVQLLAERCEGNLVGGASGDRITAFAERTGSRTADVVADSVANSARYHVFQLSEGAAGGGYRAHGAHRSRPCGGWRQRAARAGWCIAEEILLGAPAGPAPIRAIKVRCD
jgi:hypothetical protein